MTEPKLTAVKKTKPHSRGLVVLELFSGDLMLDRFKIDIAAEVERRINAHEALVTALKEILEHPAAFSDGATRLWMQAQAALAARDANWTSWACVSGRRGWRGGVYLYVRSDEMGWVWKVNIKQYITEGDSPEAMRAAYEAIESEIRSVVPWPTPKLWRDYAQLGIERGDVNIFNLGMSALYDWADEHRVWLGFA